MKKLLVFTALAEGGTGMVLAAYPPIVVQLLFGEGISGAGVVITSRLAGFGLIALGVACWPEEGSVRPFYGMMTWSVLAMLYLIYVGIRGEAVGLLLWPAVLAHAILVALLVRARFKAQKTPAA
jgi:hypothetical protein